MATKYLTVAQAAVNLGLTTARVKQLRPRHFPGAYEPLGPGLGWLIPASEIAAYQRKKAAGKLPKRGWPKGKPWPDNDLRRRKNPAKSASK